MTATNQSSDGHTKPDKTADELKDDGNECVRKGQFAEAILHYSFAIKLNPDNPILYSNRSLAFLKMKQLYYANEDAEKCIQLDSNWAKGYFRKAEVQAEAGQYDTSLLSYGRALQLQPNDVNIINAARRVANLSNEAVQYEKKLPWVGAAMGLVVGTIIVIADHLFTKAPTVKHPTLMVMLVIALSIIGYGIAKLFRYYSKLQQRGLLEPPVDLLDEFKKSSTNPTESDTNSTPNRNRYSKAQARQRFKRGKT